MRKRQPATAIAGVVTCLLVAGCARGDFGREPEGSAALLPKALKQAESWVGRIGSDDAIPMTADEEALRLRVANLDDASNDDWRRLWGLLKDGSVETAPDAYYRRHAARAFDTPEAGLNAFVSDIQLFNTHLDQFTVTADQVIGTDEARLMALRRRTGEQQLQLVHLAEVLKRMDENRRILRDTIARADARHQQFRFAAEQFDYEQPGTAALDAARGELEVTAQQIAVLRSRMDDFHRLIAEAGGTPPMVEVTAADTAQGAVTRTPAMQAYTAPGRTALRRSIAD